MPIVAIKGIHTTWSPITSIQALREATGCGIEDGKRTVFRIQEGDWPQIVVSDDEKARQLAQKLADSGAIAECEGVTFDSFSGMPLCTPYKERRIARVAIIAIDRESEIASLRVVEGTFNIAAGWLALPPNDLLNMEVRFEEAEMLEGCVKVKLLFEDPEEEEGWFCFCGDELTLLDVKVSKDIVTPA